MFALLRSYLSIYRRKPDILLNVLCAKNYGHAATNCERHSRCVKCTGNYATLNCAKQKVPLIDKKHQQILVTDIPGAPKPPFSLK